MFHSSELSLSIVATDGGSFINDGSDNVM